MVLFFLIQRLIFALLKAPYFRLFLVHFKDLLKHFFKQVALDFTHGWVDKTILVLEPIQGLSLAW